MSPVYQSPFDLIAHSNREYASKHKGSDDFEAQKDNWLPGADNCRNFSERFTFCPESLKRRAKRAGSDTPKKQYQHPLLLAYEFQELLEAGVVNNRAEIARHCGLSRARVTQVMKLLQLPDEIQEYVIAIPAREQRLCPRRRLRKVVAIRDAEAQAKAFEDLMKRLPGTDGA